MGSSDLFTDSDLLSHVKQNERILFRVISFIIAKHDLNVVY